MSTTPRSRAAKVSTKTSGASKTKSRSSKAVRREETSENNAPNTEPNTAPHNETARSSRKEAPRNESPLAQIASVLNGVTHDDFANDPEKTVITDLVPVVATRGMVAFPFMVLPLFVGREKSIRALEAASDGDKNIVLLAQRDEETEEPGADDLYRVGVLGEVAQMLKMPDGNVRVVVEGRSRVRVLEVRDTPEFFSAQIETATENDAPQTTETEALLRRLKSDFETAVGLSRNIPPEALQGAQSQENLGALADLVISYLEVSVEERQRVLEEFDATQRAHEVLKLLARELQVLEVEREIDTQVREGVGENQREFFLRERMKAIQDKLGAGGDNSFKEADQLRQKIEDAGMPQEARDKAISEVDRLEKMPSIAPEVSVIRTYVELMCDLPWSKKSDDNLDIAHAQRVLDQDHYALEKIKDRILEFLAVRKLNPTSKGPILCFVGPPGVGKTSIGKSIARALGREFIRVSVGGIHDESEIRGHRRTYIGSMPGRIISALRRVKVNNPVFLLDEIDKLGRDFRGDPSSALLEALDPEQNNAFSDHYLEVPFDLSQVMFIATANQLDPIPSALRDRLEVLRFAGYTEREKHAIATNYLIPKQIAENGITTDHITFTDEGVTKLIQDYTREAGVRNLEREIGTVCRKVAKEVAARAPEIGEARLEAGENSDGTSSTRRKRKFKTQNSKLITAKALPELLGARKYLHGVAQERDEVGVAQGLAWTEVGGELMPIEIALVAGGKGNTKLTGNLGNVMKESCEAAFTYARAHASELGIDGDWTSSHDAHIHVPAGAVPKDGPSAGVAISVALVSALTNKPVRKEIAMTGEISLRGRVLPIGGVKEKVLAAHRAGLREVMLPRENERDMDDIPDEVKRELQFHFVEHLDKALKLTLVSDAPAKGREKVTAKSSSTRRKTNQPRTK